MDFIYYIFFIMFYLSIKKCFWKDDINKVKLFFLTLLTNPFALFAVSFIATMSITLIIMIYVIISANPIDQKEVVNEVISQVKSTFVLSLSVEISWFFLFDIYHSFAYFIGKWLKAPNKSLVIFIYIMFTIIFASFLLSHDSLNTSPLLQSIVNIIDTI